MKYLLPLCFLFTVNAAMAETSLVLCQVQAKSKTSTMVASRNGQSQFLLAQGVSRNVTYFQSGLSRTTPNDMVSMAGQIVSTPAGYESLLELTLAGTSLTGKSKGLLGSPIKSEGLNAQFTNEWVSGQIDCKAFTSEYFFVGYDGRVFTTSKSLDNGYGSTLYTDDALESAGLCVGGSIQAALKSLKHDNGFEASENVTVDENGLSWIRPSCLQRSKTYEGGRGFCEISEPRGQLPDEFTHGLHTLMVCDKLLVGQARRDATLK